MLQLYTSFKSLLFLKNGNPDFWVMQSRYIRCYFCLLSYSFIIPTLPFLYSFSRFLRIDYFISQSMISWLSIKTSDLRFLFIFLFSPVHGESLKINKICCLFMPQNAFNEQNIVNTPWKSFWLINVRTYV